MICWALRKYAHEKCGGMKLGFAENSFWTSVIDVLFYVFIKCLCSHYIGKQYFGYPVLFRRRKTS